MFFDKTPEKKKKAGIITQCITIFTSNGIVLIVKNGGVCANKTKIINTPFPLSIRHER